MNTLQENAALAGLFLLPGNNKASRVYEMLATHNNLAEQSLYLNLGYWDGAINYDAACQRLAEVLGEAAGIDSTCRVLDCGFGFGDQDLYWLKRFEPLSIDGLNITESQVKKARERVAAAGAQSRIRLHLGSATRMPFADASFERVTALETAFHYDTREDFFREAFRVLKPGGRLATADILPLEEPKGGWITRLGEKLGRSFWQIPEANMYPRSQYRRKLEACGYKNVRVDSIADRVYAPFARFACERLRAPEIRARMNPVIRGAWLASMDSMSKSELDYVIAVAER